MEPTPKVDNAALSQEQTVASLQEQLVQAQEQIQLEKAGKRKLFHSLVKVASELRKSQAEAIPYQERQAYAERHWYEGGLWRAPQVLPGVQKSTALPATTRASTSSSGGVTAASPYRRVFREAVSLSDLFFNLVIVTGFTRVGVAISQEGRVSGRSLLYFAIIWNVWRKDSSYSTRFDTTDLSAQMTTLLTCFAVLFASLSVAAPLQSHDGTRIMAMAAFVAGLHCALHIRVAVTHVLSYNEGSERSSGTAEYTSSEATTTAPVAATVEAAKVLTQHVIHYAVFNVILTAAEAAVWLVGILALPMDSPYRWWVCIGGLVLGLRIPRAFLADDFHGKQQQ
jgi:Bacterial low temperature requirement A protein (LtrA)